ncbi:MAG: hypothetical protein LQ343_003553 [Gyalolechia ehrenbergii]|nr:MAG: hypothetical protein LQ343_003553 [Gyalolechia ehrenbergii]
MVLASGKSAEKFLEIHKVYGSLARIGPNHLITSDPALTQRILSVGSRYKRAKWFDALRIDPHVANIVSERDPTNHSRLRYIMSAGYAGKDVKDLQPEIDKILSAWIRRLEEEWIWKPEQPTDFDIGKRIQFLTVDIITQLCLGNQAKVRQIKRTYDLVFGSGPTKCLGTGIAGMELNKVIFEAAKQDPKEPPLVSSDVPIIGHLIGLLRHKNEYYVGLR